MKSAKSRSEGSVLYLTFVCSVSAWWGAFRRSDTAVISGPHRAEEAIALGTAMEGWLVSSAIVACALGVDRGRSLRSFWAQVGIALFRVCSS